MSCPKNDRSSMLAPKKLENLQNNKLCTFQPRFCLPLWKLKQEFQRRSDRWMDEFMKFSRLKMMNPSLIRLDQLSQILQPPPIPIS